MGFTGVGAGRGGGDRLDRIPGTLSDDSQHLALLVLYPSSPTSSAPSSNRVNRCGRPDVNHERRRDRLAHWTRRPEPDRPFGLTVMYIADNRMVVQRTASSHRQYVQASPACLRFRSIGKIIELAESSRGGGMHRAKAGRGIRRSSRELPHHPFSSSIRSPAMPRRLIAISSRNSEFMTV